jgi:outer membrane receptor protein involved in Fe transport
MIVKCKLFSFPSGVSGTKFFNMKRNLLALFLLLPFFTISAFGEMKFVVSGQALDSVTQETLPYVTCSVLSDNNKQVVTRFAGDMDGKFKGELKSPGKYTLIISCVGKKPYSVKFSVDDKSNEVHIGRIAMSASQQALKELEVVAVKPLIKAEADKVTYDLEQDPESKSSTVLDMMRKVPMVTVDGQDNIQLKGSSNFKFFLNGKPTNMFNNNPGLILKSMPANMVKNIEVITQPGAKYDAEGVGGIINIVTLQNTTTDGYSATINAQVSSRGSYSSGLNLMFQKGKFSFSGNYSYNFNKQFPVTTSSERNTYITGTPYPFTRQEATVDNETPMQFGSGQLTYELDTLNLFTFSFNRRYGRTLSETNAITESYDADLNKIFEYSQSSTQHQSWGSTDLGLDYQHSFRKKDENLTLSYKLSNMPNNSDFVADNILNPLYVSRPQPGLAQHSESNNIASTNEHTFQADYSNPWKEGHTLEMGAKYIKRLNDSKIDESYKYFDFSKTSPFTPLIAFDSISDFFNNQDIMGAYTSYTASFDKWSVKGGLRYEYTWLKAEFNESARNFSTDYGALVPSALITYMLKDMQSLKLGYNKRIQRPGIGYLNPYVDRRDPNYISYGNPELDPEMSHNITLGYSSFAPKYNISADLSYTFVNNAIEQFSFIREGSSVQETTYDNIGHNKQLGLNFFGSYRGIKWLNLYTNSSVSYVELKSSTMNLTNQGLSGRLYLGGSIMLPKDLRISLGGGGSLPQIMLQGTQSAFYFSYMAITKEFFKKRLSLSLSGVYLPLSHIYLSTNGTNIVNGLPTFKQTTDVHLTSNAELRFNVSYRIGNMKTQVKKTNSTIENDDEKVKENSSMGQSPM